MAILRRPMRIGWMLAASLLCLTARGAELEYEAAPISYLTAQATDPVAHLMADLESGKRQLKFDDRYGYLPAVLEALEVPENSQTLVFSKTSFQAHLINPQRPRALYFSDDVYIGYVPEGDVVEMSAADPALGAVFYTLDQKAVERPLIERRTHDCLQCHSSPRTCDVPGHVVRSVFPDRRGMPIYHAGTFDIDHTSPLSERWGGWYVTGKHGKQTHMGNQIARDVGGKAEIDSAAGANLLDLTGRCEIGVYLKPSSDIVALMVLEHQTQMHNRIARAAIEEQMAAYYDESLNESLERPADYRSETFHRRCDRQAEKLLEYALYCGETQLTEPIEGNSEFAAEFTAKGVRDAEGRSLRDLDLHSRLFRYPLSYLVYSEPMKQLPPAVKEHFYRGLGRVLAGEDRDPKYAKLDVDTRRAIHEILLATHEDYRALSGR